MPIGGEDKRGEPLSVDRQSRLIASNSFYRLLTLESRPRRVLFRLSFCLQGIPSPQLYVENHPIVFLIEKVEASPHWLVGVKSKGFHLDTFRYGISLRVFNIPSSSSPKDWTWSILTASNNVPSTHNSLFCYSAYSVIVGSSNGQAVRRRFCLFRPILPAI